MPAAFDWAKVHQFKFLNVSIRK